ncbi:MAG: hypothetical protein M0C28_36085 [Candidatus Moduliflexus flocculans]|nr:hypothetical protein [Candidatus Moduliflexus flocculans]
MLDVVYNHTFHGGKSNLNYLVQQLLLTELDLNHHVSPTAPGWVTSWPRNSPMVRRFIIDSLKYWLTEYRVDGFRFDLLGLYDRETVKHPLSRS